MSFVYSLSRQFTSHKFTSNVDRFVCRYHQAGNRRKMLLLPFLTAENLRWNEELKILDDLLSDAVPRSDAVMGCMHIEKNEFFSINLLTNLIVKHSRLSPTNNAHSTSRLRLNSFTRNGFLILVICPEQNSLFRSAVSTSTAAIKKEIL